MKRLLLLLPIVVLSFSLVADSWNTSGFKPDYTQMDCACPGAAGVPCNCSIQSNPCDFGSISAFFNMLRQSSAFKFEDGSYIYLKAELDGYDLQGNPIMVPSSTGTDAIWIDKQATTSWYNSNCK